MTTRMVIFGDGDQKRNRKKGGRGRVGAGASGCMGSVIENKYNRSYSFIRTLEWMGYWRPVRKDIKGKSKTRKGKKEWKKKD